MFSILEGKEKNVVRENKLNFFYLNVTKNKEKNSDQHICKWHCHLVNSGVFGMEEMKPLFLHCLADDALKAFNSFQLAKDAAVEQIIGEFDKCIIGEINVAYERYCFNKRQHINDESFEQFFADLQRLIKRVNFVTWRDSILRDQFFFQHQRCHTAERSTEKKSLNFETVCWHVPSKWKYQQAQQWNESRKYK